VTEGIGRGRKRWHKLGREQVTDGIDDGRKGDGRTDVEGADVKRNM
jgi:hypothetical protein